MAVLFLDLNGFKLVNDAYGHAAGDAVLKSVAQRLLSSLRPGDTAARLGGDEFTMMSPGIRQPADATGLADRLITQMLAPFDIGITEVELSASIGIALARGKGVPAVAVIAAADEAMYRAKRDGHVRYVLSDWDAQASARGRTWCPARAGASRVTDDSAAAEASAAASSRVSPRQVPRL